MKLLKIPLSFFIFIFLFFLCQSRILAFSTGTLNQLSGKPQYASDRILVKYKISQSPDEITDPQKKAGLLQSLAANGVIRSQKMKLKNNYLYVTNGTIPVETVSKNLKLKTEIEQVEFDKFQYILQVAPPNDPYFSSMWNLTKLQMLSAWSLAKGNNSIKVAVVDTGVAYNHPDFIGRSFVNGYNFVNGTTDPLDDNGHGTHVAGTIGAVVNNSAGISGIDWNISLMALKALDSTGSGYGSDIANAITYAADNGAKVINLSLGGVGACAPGDIEQTAINYAKSKGALVVVAAGNDNADAGNYTPASCSNIISVAAGNSSDIRSYYSNYGSVVDLMAPGGDDTPCTGKSGTDLQNCYLANLILSLWTGNQYYFAEGTSMAAPHVSAAAALLFSLNNSLTPDQVKMLLKNNTDPASTDAGKPIGTGRVNAYKALQSLAVPTITPLPTVTPYITLTPTPYINLQSTEILPGSSSPYYGIKNIWSPETNNQLASLMIWNGDICKTSAGYNPGDLFSSESTGMTKTISIVQHALVKPKSTYCSQIWLDFNKGIPASNPSIVTIYHQCDLNQDNKINLSDSLIVLQSWLATGSAKYQFREDINKDGKVNALDLSQVLKNWGL